MLFLIEQGWQHLHNGTLKNPEMDKQTNLVIEQVFSCPNKEKTEREYAKTQSK